MLGEMRPDHHAHVAHAAARAGVEPEALAALAHAVTHPHWSRVAEAWLGDDDVGEWRRFRCPTCGGLPALAEHRSESASTGECDLGSTSTCKWMHCLFCGSGWSVPPLECPACGSTRAGDARYFFHPEEPELRIEFCKGCRRYVKSVDADKIAGRIHVGLEALTTTHLDTIARERDLKPLDAVHEKEGE
jgi:formate dehydrogenase maturation protein FdhE